MPLAIFEIEVFKVFALAMVRFAGLILAAPILSSNNFPMQAKAALAALAALAVLPAIPAQEALPTGLPAFGLLAIGELLIGIMMGSVMTLTFAAIQVAGQIVDMLSGFALANVFNPAFETQVPVFGFFFFVLAGLYLLVLDGHHMMLRHLALTFDRIPLGGFVLRPALLLDVARWGSLMFLDGLLIAAPVAAVLLLAYVTMGLMSRVVPQIHLFVVGFPITLALSLFTAALFIEAYLVYVRGMFGRMWDNVLRLLPSMT
jgi:flagellar biosynthetic protein FliR